MVVNDTDSKRFSVTAQKAPIMNNAPWAKLTTPSVPKMRVSPRAISAYAALVQTVQDLKKYRVHRSQPGSTARGGSPQPR
jgi:hypothetical protein